MEAFWRLRDGSDPSSCAPPRVWSLNTDRPRQEPGRAETNWAAREVQRQQREPLPRQPAPLMNAACLGGSEMAASPPRRSSHLSSHSSNFYSDAPHPHQSGTILAKASNASLLQLLSLRFSLVYLYPRFFLSLSCKFQFQQVSPRSDKVRKKERRKKGRKKQQEGLSFQPGSVRTDFTSLNMLQSLGRLLYSLSVSSTFSDFSLDVHPGR